jgi:hypothetical protein
MNASALSVRAGLIPDPAAKLEEPLIVRPTSETIIWDMSPPLPLPSHSLLNTRVFSPFLSG